jgi:RHS repeat-associated protein
LRDAEIIMNETNAPADNMNQPTGGTFTHDPQGNLKTYNGWIYTYDAQNRLTNASLGTTNAVFYYDAKNRQVARSINNVFTFSIWDDWELIEEYGSANVISTKYLQGAHGPIKNLITNIYYYQDSLGSTSHIASSTGALLESYRYDLNGKPTYWNPGGTQISASAYGIRDLFTGERFVTELGLYDLRNRYYSPDLGRFLQPDPVGFKGDASNLYRYCGNDWANRSDPMGLDGDPIQNAGSPPKGSPPGAYKPSSVEKFLIEMNKGALTIGLETFRTVQNAGGKPGDLVATSPKVEEQAKVGAKRIEQATNDGASRSLVIQYDPKTRAYSVGRDMPKATSAGSGGGQTEVNPPNPDNSSLRRAGELHSHFDHKPISGSDLIRANTLQIKSFILLLPERLLYRYTPRNNAEPTGQMQGTYNLLPY